MSRQSVYYQPYRQVFLPDPFVYQDLTYQHNGYYNEPQWDDMSCTDESADTPGLVDEEPVVSDDMSDWVEYGDDIIDAGPTSFSKDEYYPSQEELLKAQAAVQTVNPLDLLLKRPAGAEKMQMSLGTYSKASLCLSDTMTGSSSEVYHHPQPQFSSYEPTQYFAPMQHHQVSSCFQNTLCELGGDEMDQTADFPHSASPGESTSSVDRPTGPLTMVGEDGEEYEAWYFEAILDSRRGFENPLCELGDDEMDQTADFTHSASPGECTSSVDRLAGQVTMLDEDDDEY